MRPHDDRAKQAEVNRGHSRCANPQYNPPSVELDSLSRLLESFLADARSATILEDGEELFSLAPDSATPAKYSLSSANGKCLLHLWSADRNAVRRVLDVESKKDALWLRVQRFGHAQPSKMQIMRESFGRNKDSVGRVSARKSYARLLEKVLQRGFPDLAVGRLTSAMDLERSFGPIYARGLIRRGRSGFAVFGVNAQESQASVDAALTFALLWLDQCRERESKLVVEGLKLFVPPGSAAVVRERMACLDHATAKFELYLLDEREQSLEQLDCRDRGNIATRLVRWTDLASARERFAESIERVFALLTSNSKDTVEIAPVSSAEIAFRLRGLEFARARLAQEPASFAQRQEVIFDAGANETVLALETEELFRQLTQRLFQSRTSEGGRSDALWRMQPERWLESLVLANVAAIDSNLDSAEVYSQVPAFSCSDRAMIDVLACTRERRLAVLELKADEDIHLPLQGLDYWSRVSWHHSRGEFQKFGYFTGGELAPQAPLLYLVAPALRVHPATDALLRYLAPEIDCTLVGIDERWRHGVRRIFRKKARTATGHGAG